MAISGPALLATLREHHLLDEKALDRIELEYMGLLYEAQLLADELVRRGLLTPFQSEELLAGRGAALSLGKYVLLDRIGSGGMGQVYRAMHRILKAVRAVKIIHPDCLTSKLTVQRFHKEMVAVSQLKHANIVLAHDADQEGDRHYFVMEYVPGHDLARVVHQQGPLPVGLACEYVRQAALGLQHAHDKGLVHRDVKPANLLLSTEDNQIKVLDLGLAQLRSSQPESEGARPITPAGMMMGTPDFMAPEQAEDSSGVDGRADIYSLGCTLYQLLTGQVPFPGGTLVQKLTRHHSSQAAPVHQQRADVPPALSAVVARMMAKAPSERYQQAAEVAAALAPFSTSVAAPGAMVPHTRVEPPATEAGSSAGAGPDSATAQFPQTLQLPSMPSDGADTSMVTVATAGRRRQEALPPPARPSAWLKIAAGVLAALAAACVVLFVLKDRLWPPTAPDGRVEVKKPDEGPPPRKTAPEVPPDTKKDGDKKGEEKKDGDKKEPDPKPPVVPEPPPRGVARGAGSPDDPAPARAGKGEPAVSKARDWRQVVPLQSIKSPTRQVVLSASGDRAAAVPQRIPGVQLYDLGRPSDLPLLTPEQLMREVRDPVLAQVALSPDGTHLGFTTIVSTARPVRGVTRLFQKYDGLGVWDGRTTRLCFGEVAVPRNGRLEPSTRLLVFTGDGKGLLTGVGTQVQRWDLSGGDDLIDRAAATYATGTPVDALACSPDGKHVVAAGRDKVLRVYALAGRDEPLAELQGHQSLVTAVAYAGPETVVSADVEGAWLVWRLGADRKPVAPQELPRWHERSVVVLACSARDELAATADSEGRVCVGKLGDKKPLWKDRADGATVRSLAFAADGHSVVYATDSGLGRILLRMPTPGIATSPPRRGDPVAAGKP